MSKTSSQLPVCVYCGTARPADETLCPTCGKPWIDTTIGSTTPVEVAPEADEGDDTQDMPIVPPVVPQAADPQDPEPAPDAGSAPDVVAPPPPLLGDGDDFAFDDWTEEPTEKRRSAAAWLIPLVIAVAAAVVWVVIFIDSPPAPVTSTVAAAPTTTAPEPTTTTAADAEVGDTAPTTTTVAPPTPVTFPPPSAWPPLGEALAVDEFPMKAAGIGPLDFGMSIEEVAGLLGASFGEAIASGVDRVCQPEESYWLQWGDLMVIFDNSDPGASYVSYRNETSDVSGPGLGFSTLSGLKLGDTVADLRSTYPSYTISFDRVDSITYFNLFEGGDLLLWGPISSPEADGVIEGIYSPSPCPAS